MGDVIYPRFEQVPTWRQAAAGSSLRRLSSGVLTTLCVVPPAAGCETAPKDTNIHNLVFDDQSYPQTALPKASREDIIAAVAADPDLVAAVELDMVGWSDAVEERRLNVIEEVGLEGLRQDIIQFGEISPEDFEVAYEMCREHLREKHDTGRADPQVL